MERSATARTRLLPSTGERAVRAPGESPPGIPERLLLGRYRLDRRVGAGAFGVVWSAWDERLEREVAVKVVPRDGPGERPEREARAAARLNHPGIVALYELAADEDAVYLVSELVHGSTLAELLGGGAVSDRDVARIGAALCDALAHAHARGVIHRDVKPQNVMVVAEPAAGAGFAKLTDFGVAFVGSRDPLTRTGDVVGTLAYMAPEQADGRRVTPACDVYSLALTLYEAWTGSNPVRARGPAATAKRLGRPLPPLDRRRRDLPSALCDALDAALAPDPEERPAAAVLGRALRTAEPALDDEGGLVEPGTLERFGLTAARPRPGPAGRRLIGRAAAGLAAGMLVLGGLALASAPLPVSPLAAAAAATLAVALLPRAGWALAAVAVCAWLASPEVGRPGAALLLAAMLAPVPVLLPRAGPLWSLPALAPLLGGAGVAVAFVGLAGLCGSAWRRAGLAAAGFLWVAGAELLSGEALLFGVPDGALPPEDWWGSAPGALVDALHPLLSSPAVAPLVVWAAFAAVLPVLVRGRYLGVDLLAAAAWAAGLACAQLAAAELIGASTALGEPRGTAAGAALAGIAAVAATSLRRAPDADGFEPTTGA